MQNTAIVLILGFLGVLAHCLIKANSLKTDAIKANLPWVFSDYLKNDWIVISLSFVSVFAWFFLFEEVATKYPKLQDFVRVSFFVMGLVGSYLIQTVSSKSRKIIRKEVDEKTNELEDIKQQGI